MHEQERAAKNVRDGNERSISLLSCCEYVVLFVLMFAPPVLSLSSRCLIVMHEHLG